MARKKDAATELFGPKGAEKVYAAIVAGLRRRVGAAEAVEDPKQTCMHITAGKGGVAYLGLHPRTGGVLVTIRTEKPLKSPRVRKAEQASANRCHCDVLVSSVDEVDDELLGWLETAAGLVKGKRGGRPAG